MTTVKEILSAETGTHPAPIENLAKGLASIEADFVTKFKGSAGHVVEAQGELDLTTEQAIRALTPLLNIVESLEVAANEAITALYTPEVVEPEVPTPPTTTPDNPVPSN